MLSQFPVHCGLWQIGAWRSSGHDLAQGQGFGFLQGLLWTVQSHHERYAQHCCTIDLWLTYSLSTDRVDPGDRGGEYRSLIGLPGGTQHAQYAAIEQAANEAGFQLVAGKGSDPDTLKKQIVYVYDTAKYPFYQAEIYHQFHVRIVVAGAFRISSFCHRMTFNRLPTELPTTSSPIALWKMVASRFAVVPIASKIPSIVKL